LTHTFSFSSPFNGLPGSGQEGRFLFLPGHVDAKTLCTAYRFVEPHRCGCIRLFSGADSGTCCCPRIANLIVIEQARACGIVIDFKTHAKVGVPVTLWSLLVIVGWIYG
jgi:hypothetical protein